MTLSLDAALLFSCAIFAVGVYGVLVRQNLIVILMCLELMLNAVNLAIVAVGRALLPSAASTDQANTAQVFVLMVLAVAAAEAAVGLSVLLAVYRKWRTARAGEIELLKG